MSASLSQDIYTESWSRIEWISGYRHFYFLVGIFKIRSNSHLKAENFCFFCHNDRGKAFEKEFNMILITGAKWSTWNGAVPFVPDERNEEYVAAGCS